MPRGWSGSKLWIPVPPRRRGSSWTPGARTRPPVPWGPSKPLWPVKHRASTGTSVRSIGSTPAVWTVSSTKRAPCSRHSRLASAMGVTLPVTLDAWVSATTFVSGRNAEASSSSRNLPRSSIGTTVQVTPSLHSAWSGRSTELCSIAEVMTWSPGTRSPRSATLRASVTFLANATRPAPGRPRPAGGAPKSSATAPRARWRIRPASRDESCAPRPALPSPRSAPVTASMTASGFQYDVAALSR